MELQEALGILEQVCANYQGNLADHQKIQTALQAVIAEVTPEDGFPLALPQDGDRPEPKPNSTQRRQTAAK